MKPRRVPRPGAEEWPASAGGGFAHSFVITEPGTSGFPWVIPSLKGFCRLALHPCATFLVGDNGSGKSTLLEAIAQTAGFPEEGGSRNFSHVTREYWSELGSAGKLIWGARRPKDGFFLRAESFYNVATRVDEIEKLSPRPYRFYGGKSLHAQSHGEAFLSLAVNRWGGEGLYLLDEPEAALSPARQLALLRIFHLHQGSQFVIATHSPILMAYPDARIYRLSDAGINPVAYEETDHYRVTRDFLNHRERYLEKLGRRGSAE